MARPRLADVHELTRQQARRVAVHAQALTADRPRDLFDAVDRVGALQLDPAKAIAPSADLVLFSRLGPGYDPADLRGALDELSLLEFRGTARTPEDLAEHLAEMAAWPGTGELQDWKVQRLAWVRANDAWRREILDLLRSDGPLRAQDLPESCVLPWRSSGWNDSRNKPMMLDLLAQRGEIAAAGSRGRDRLWDLADRVYPEDPGLDVEQARAARDVRRLRTFGIARAPGPVQVLDPLEGRDVGEPAVVEGVRGTWRVDPASLDRDFTGRVALLSPFDRLVADRKRMTDLFDFDYQLEMFKPAAKRRWGYYALPVLDGDRLVGKLDATADRDHGVLRVHAVHEDEPFDRRLRKAVEQEIADLAEWLDLAIVRA